MSTTTEYVFAGKNNEFKLLIQLGGTPIDFDTATRYVLTLTNVENDQEIIIDTDTNAGAIAGDSVGIVTFIIGLLVDSTDAGLYNSTLCVFDPLHVEGQIVIDYCASGFPNMRVSIC
jgi:hypothetical protein